jgi:hypothetical protein
MDYFKMSTSMDYFNPLIQDGPDSVENSRDSDYTNDMIPKDSKILSWGFD